MRTSWKISWRRGVRGSCTDGWRQWEEEEGEEVEEEEEGAADTSGLLPAAQTVTARLSTGAELRAIQTFTSTSCVKTTKAPRPRTSPLPWCQ